MKLPRSLRSLPCGLHAASPPTNFLPATAALALSAALMRPAAGYAQQSGVGISGTADKARLENVFSKKPGYSPYAGRNFPTRPLFGDTHLHTGFSMDASHARSASLE